MVEQPTAEAIRRTVRAAGPSATSNSIAASQIAALTAP